MGNCRSDQMIEFELLYADKKLGRENVISHPLLVSMLWFYRKRTYQALRLAEQEKGAPVNYPEVVRAFRRISRKPLPSPRLIDCCLSEFYWNDDVLCDRENNHYSVNKRMQHTDINPTGFDLYSDRITRMFPGYAIDNEMRVRPGPDTPTLSFKYIKELLLSKDLSR